MTDEDIKAESRIPEWYAGRSVLVTGGTGFLGKVLVEKLLRSCPNIANIYLLVRPKKGKDVRERLEEYKSNMVFSQLRETRPNFAQQLLVVTGDISGPDFRLAEDALLRLRRDVSVVFHCAASVRFNDTLRGAVTSNLVGTKRMLQLAEQLPHLQTFVYVSTSYCHSDLEVLDEKVYPANADPEKVIDIVSWMDDDQLAVVTRKLLGKLPNTYVLSKNLAEQLVANYSSKLPIVIARPSIVVPSWKEPVPGWVDSKNGPVGLLLAGAKGVGRIFLGNVDLAPDFIPVDCVSNATIALAWYAAETRQESPFVCNVTNGERLRVTWRRVLQINLEVSRNEIPFEGGLWYPIAICTTSTLFCTIYCFVFDVIPAYIIDFLIALSGRRRFMVHIQNQLRVGRIMTKYYTLHEWLFINKRLRQLEEYMSREDRETFYSDISAMNVYEYLKGSVMGVKVYIMKEDMANIPKAHKHLRRLYWLHISVKVIFYGLLLWLLYSTAEPIMGGVEIVIEYFTSLFSCASFIRMLKNDVSTTNNVTAQTLVQITS